MTGHAEKVGIENFEFLKVLGTGGMNILILQYKFHVYKSIVRSIFEICNKFMPCNCYFLVVLAYGKVFLVKKKDGFYRGKLFAMKVLKKATIVQKAKTTEHTMTERQVLEAVRSCPFLVTLHWAFQTESKLHLVMGR